MERVTAIRRREKRERCAVTKKEIVKAISDETGLTQLEIKRIVQRTFDAIIETLVKEGRVELRNFGVFQVRPRAARKARNPRTGHQVTVPEKFVVTFKPGKEMEHLVKSIDSVTAERIRAQAAEIDLTPHEDEDDFSPDQAR
jgi:nucleoid DNA-binding protein